ncbi:MAG: hypothetical protein HKL85_05235 [Acidimicrobiaceae bacterium]|nr:hypothetical protein [Acidimicrobiaceae bacterium]
MRKLVTQIAAGAMVIGSVAMFGATGSGASTPKAATTTTMAPPFVTGNKWLSVNVDNVMGNGSPGVTSGCYLANNFIQGQTVVFRMWGTDNLNGKPLLGDVSPTTPIKGSNVQSVVILDLPGVSPNPQMTYNTRDGYFTYGWFTNASTPTGVVPFRVVVTLKPVPATYKTVKVMVNGVMKNKRVIKTPAIPSKGYAYSQSGVATGTGSLAAPSQLTINAAG